MPKQFVMLNSFQHLSAVELVLPNLQFGSYEYKHL